jgi:hypothetical protein
LFNVPSKDSSALFFVGEGVIRSSFQFLSSLPSKLIMKYRMTSMPTQTLNANFSTNKFNTYTDRFLNDYLIPDSDSARNYSVFLAKTKFPNSYWLKVLALTDPIPGKRVLVDVPNHDGNDFQLSRTIVHELGHAIAAFGEGKANTVMEQGFKSFTNFDIDQQKEIEKALLKTP